MLWGFQKLQTLTSSLLGAMGSFASFGQKSEDTTLVGRISSWIRLIMRVLLLGMVFYIFLLWPVSDPVGFKQWITLMSETPEQIWYVIWAILFSWGASEVVSRTTGGSSGGSYGGGGYGDSGGYGGYDAGHSLESEIPPSDFGGRFSNVDSEDESLLETPPPNPVIEDWAAKGKSE